MALINLFPFESYPVAVFGLGRSGLTAAKALVESEAEEAEEEEAAVTAAAAIEAHTV